MLHYAEGQFDLSRQLKDGSTIADHYRQLAKARGISFSEVNPYADRELPIELGSVWECFTELSNTRGSNGFSPNKLSYTEIYAWSQLLNVVLQPWEIELLMRLDNLWMKTWNEGQSDA